jgi:ribosomal protein S18 acetylase RimI-like enzyme
VAAVDRAAREAMHVRPFEARDEDAVVDLWRVCGLVRPQNDPHRDIRRKLAVRPDLFLVGLLGGQVVATVMAGYEGHRGWLNYVAVHPAHRREGLAREIVLAAEVALRTAGCPKVNLQIRSTNAGVIEFYHRIGYSKDDVVSMGKRLICDT